MKTFTAADGRRCVERVTPEQQAERDAVLILSFLMPLAMILVFALAAGMI